MSSSFIFWLNLAKKKEIQNECHFQNWKRAKKSEKKIENMNLKSALLKTPNRTKLRKIVAFIKKKLEFELNELLISFNLSRKMAKNS